MKPRQRAWEKFNYSIVYFRALSIGTLFEMFSGILPVNGRFSGRECGKEKKYPCQLPADDV